MLQSTEATAPGPSAMDNMSGPKSPSGPGWARITVPSIPNLEFGHSVWRQTWMHGATGALVVSSLEPSSEDDTPEVGRYCLSVTLAGRRCSAANALWVLAEFDLLEAVEENFTPSARVRTFIHKVLRAG